MVDGAGRVSSAGVSIWLDDLSRERIKSGSLAHLISTSFVSGVTTNPSIFSSAISTSSLYRQDILRLKNRAIEEIILELTTNDVRSACDLFQDIFTKSKKADGRVSIEVDPRLARDTVNTINQGKELWRIIDRENLLIKVPATKEGLPAITELIALGISVNVTLIFSLSRYLEVIEAFVKGLEIRIEEGREISDIHSVASFFISRIDSEVDKLLPAESDLKGKVAVSNAVLAYQAYYDFKQSDRWKRISEKGGNLQRPLWASTGVKDPKYSPTKYVAELIAKDVVNTMPEKTLNAVRDLENVDGNSIISNYDSARLNIAKLALAGIDLDKITNDLEFDGVNKFEVSWFELMNTIKNVIDNN
jgi:transaldolase